VPGSVVLTVYALAIRLDFRGAAQAAAGAACAALLLAGASLAASRAVAPIAAQAPDMLRLTGGAALAGVAWRALTCAGPRGEGPKWLLQSHFFLQALGRAVTQPERLLFWGGLTALVAPLSMPDAARVTFGAALISCVAPLAWRAAFRSPAGRGRFVLRRGLMWRASGAVLSMTALVAVLRVTRGLA
jgi:threonine/homoserine/homoserine lactone efflux protein